MVFSFLRPARTMSIIHLNSKMPYLRQAQAALVDRAGITDQVNVETHFKSRRTQAFMPKKGGFSKGADSSFTQVLQTGLPVVTHITRPLATPSHRVIFR